MILTPERLGSIASKRGLLTTSDADALVQHIKAMDEKLAEVTLERDMLLGKPDAVHLGAQAAVTALRQVQQTHSDLATAQARIVELERIVNRIKEEVARWGKAYPEDVPMFAPLPNPNTERHELQMYRTRASAGMGRHMSKAILGQIAGIETEGKEL